ncbi:hypothetical protein ACFQ0B_50430 [Nonomuraea thailandensis]
MDAARLQGGHAGHHEHGDEHEHGQWGADPAGLEHAHERESHNWGQGRPWKPGDPVPAPIISTLPVRSRSRGRWDGDGM